MKTPKKRKSTATPIELPLLMLRDHTAVRNLSMANFGGYVRLMMAAIIDGVDVLHESDFTLACIVHQTAGNWKRPGARGKIMQAVRASLGEALETYQARRNRRDSMILLLRSIGTTNQTHRRAAKGNVKSALIADSPASPSRDVLLVPSNLHKTYLGKSERMNPPLPPRQRQSTSPQLTDKI